MAKYDLMFPDKIKRGLALVAFLPLLAVAMDGNELLIIAHGPGGSGKTCSNRYRGAGLGQGRVLVDGCSSHECFQTTVSNITQKTKVVTARGYKVGDVDDVLDCCGNDRQSAPSFSYQDACFDSYLYGWIVYSSNGGFSAMNEYANCSNCTIEVSLQAQVDENQSSQTMVEAVFSKEYLASDNMGDINHDCIPDIYRASFPKMHEDEWDDLQDLHEFNNDQDYFPILATTGYAGFVPCLSNTWVVAGTPFTAELEIRGYGAALNDAPALAGIKNVAPEQVYSDPDVDERSTLSKLEYLAWTDYTNAHPTATIKDWSPERPSNPTMEDTDGDGIQDGLEYYCWYRAHVGYLDLDNAHRYLTGRRYSIARWPEGETITSAEIETLMDPIVARKNDVSCSDSDADGLSDSIELLLGTNPFDYDTDGDGMPDGYEVFILHTDPLRFSTDLSGMPDSDIVEIPESVDVCYDGLQHAIPYENTNALVRVLWSETLDGSFSIDVPAYSEIGVYTNWCYAVLRTDAHQEYRGAVRKVVTKIQPDCTRHYSIMKDGIAWSVQFSMSGESVFRASIAGAENCGNRLVIPTSMIGCPVTEIAHYAFTNESDIVSVYIPEGIESIGYHAFAFDDSLRAIDVAEGNPWYKSIGGALYDKEGAVLLIVPAGLESVTLPDGLLEIQIMAFYSCRKLHALVVPGSVRFIGNGAFYDSGLSTITFLGPPPAVAGVPGMGALCGDDYWWIDRVRSGNLRIFVYPGTSGWKGWFSEWHSLPDYERLVESIEYVGQQLAAPLGGEGTSDAFLFYDSDRQRLVSVPQSWLAEYELLKSLENGCATVQTLTPISNRSLYQSYVAGLNPTNENDEFKASIEIVDGDVKVSWSPKLSSEETAIRKYTTYGCKTLGGEWTNMELVSDHEKPDYHFFKVSVDIQ